jgi:hypothetical protein
MFGVWMARIESSLLGYVAGEPGWGEGDMQEGRHSSQGNKSALLLDADRVEKFRAWYGGFTNIQEIPTLLTGEIVFEKKKKGTKGKGKK